MKFQAFGKIPKSNNKIGLRGKIDTAHTQIHDCSHSCLGTATSIESSEVKQVTWALATPLSEMMRPCKCFPNMSKMPILIYNQANSVIMSFI
jgi:hypothetical protein